MSLSLWSPAAWSYPLPPGHRFPVSKYTRLAERVVTEGLIHAEELHAPDALMPRAMALAASFEGASPLATSLVKRTMVNPGELAALLDTEANAQALAFGSSYLQQAAQRFLAKQPPAFQWPAAPGKE